MDNPRAGRDARADATKRPFVRPKLTYVTPKLVELGDVRALTDGLIEPNSAPTIGGFFGQFDPS